MPRRSVPVLAHALIAALLAAAAAPAAPAAKAAKTAKAAKAANAAGERPHLAAAVDAAKWIRASAIKSERGITWPGDPSDPKSVSPILYSGSSGVVLFFLELHRATGRAEYLDEARAGADRLLADIEQEMPPGLYTGEGRVRLVFACPDHVARS